MTTLRRKDEQTGVNDILVKETVRCTRSECGGLLLGRGARSSQWKSAMFPSPSRSLTREEVRTVDEKAMALGVPGIVLMESKPCSA